MLVGSPNGHDSRLTILRVKDKYKFIGAFCGKQLENKKLRCIAPTTESVCDINWIPGGNWQYGIFGN